MTDPSSSPATADGRARPAAEGVSDTGLTTVPEPRRGTGDPPPGHVGPAPAAVEPERASREDDGATDEASTDPATEPARADTDTVTGTGTERPRADEAADPPQDETAGDTATGDGGEDTAVVDDVAERTPVVPAVPPPATPAAPAPPDAEREHRTTHRAASPPHGREARRTVPVTRRRRLAARITIVLLVLLLAGVVTLAVHLYRTTTAWQERAEEYRTASSSLGEQLALSRAEVAGTQSELEAVRGQLANATTRIDELANEKAQVTDDREAQRQLVDYQERVTEAAGKVALALDQCVQGQDQLITYLEAQAAAAEAGTDPPYDDAELQQYGTDVETLCRTASEANVSLQDELDR